MERLGGERRTKEPWNCRLCNSFQALTLRILLRHYNIVHANEPNFRVVCGIEDCPATFRLYNSFYKHVSKCHKELYDEKLLVTDKGVVDATDHEDEVQCCGRPDDTCESDSSENAHEHGSDISLSSDEFENGVDLDKEQNFKIDIQKSAASFLLKVKEINKIPQVAMESIMDSTQTLIKQVVSSVKSDVLKVLESSDEKDMVENVFKSCPDPFVGIKTEALQSKYIKENFNYVQHRIIPLGQKLSRKKQGPNRVICEKEENFIYIPVLQSLKQMLSNERISSMVMRKPKCCSHGVFYDIHDGKIYQSDEYFQQHENALSLVLYHDELEVCNPIGNNAGTHKLDMYYYTIGNICPKFRSKRCAVRLFAIANANLVKKYGIDCIMKPLIDDLQLLYNGNQMEINGVEKVFYGKVLMCAGDTLGQHYWAGFKEGVGAAFQKCRNCQCAFEQMQTDFRENAFSLRTKESYDHQCVEIEQAPNENIKKDLQTTYGINKRSILCELPTFDVTKQLPQDIMHTLLEGTVQYEIRLVLQHYIQSGVTTLTMINGAIASHRYGYTEISDKPDPIRETVFFGDERYKLKYKAAQARLFLRLLPFIIGPLVDRADPYYLFLVELIHIVQLVFSPVIKSDTIHYLKQIIDEHLSNFKKLFPNSNILPKQHYLVHIPSTIQQLGPMIRSACFSFESAHSYFKELARKQNFKNLPLSLAKRNQFKECCNFGDSNESPSCHPLFSNEKLEGVVKKVNAENCESLREKLDASSLLPGLRLANVYKLSWVELYGTRYKKAGVLAVDACGDPVLPVFGIILCIWSVSSYIYFEVELLETACFDYLNQAYQVKKLDDGENCGSIFSYEGLVDFNVFHIKDDHYGNQYVPVKYDIDDLMEEHVEGRNPVMA